MSGKQQTTVPKTEVICVGTFVADVFLLPVERWPARGELVTADKIMLSCGGCAANTARALQRLGIGTAAIGVVGDDPFGKMVVTALREDAVDVSGMMVDSSLPTQSCVVAVGSDGERSLINIHGAARSLLLQQLDLSIHTNARVLHMGGAFNVPGLDGEPTASLFHNAHARNMITSLDTSWDASGGWMKTLKPALPFTDVLFCNLEEGRFLTGQSSPRQVMKRLLENGPGMVILKLGADGCMAGTTSQEFEIKGFPVTVVDTSGAGDAFVAGFWASRLHGATIEEAGRVANAVGALCVTGVGTLTAIENMTQVRQFLTDASKRCERSE